MKDNKENIWSKNC